MGGNTPPFRHNGARTEVKAAAYKGARLNRTSLTRVEYGLRSRMASMAEIGARTSPQAINNSSFSGKTPSMIDGTTRVFSICRPNPPSGEWLSMI